MPRESLQLQLRVSSGAWDFFEGLSAKPAATVPYLGLNSILPQSGSDFLWRSSVDDTVWETNIRIDTTL